MHMCYTEKATKARHAYVPTYCINSVSRIQTSKHWSLATHEPIDHAYSYSMDRCHPRQGDSVSWHSDRSPAKMRMLWYTRCGTLERTAGGRGRAAAAASPARRAPLAPPALLLPSPPPTVTACALAALPPPAPSQMHPLLIACELSVATTGNRRWIPHVSSAAHYRLAFQHNSH